MIDSKEVSSIAISSNLFIYENYIDINSSLVYLRLGLTFKTIIYFPICFGRIFHPPIFGIEQFHIQIF